MIRVNAPVSSGGIECCWMRCCTCVNVSFVKSDIGLLKIIEVVFGSLCQSLAINYGLAYASTMGAAYHGFITTASWCLMTTMLLCVCYVLSANSLYLVRQSLFEFLFNGFAAFSYISSSSYLGFAVNTFLYPQYLVTPHFQVYPAISAAYMMGTFVGAIYAYDAYRSYKYYKGYR